MINQGVVPSDDGDFNKNHSNSMDGPAAQSILFNQRDGGLNGTGNLNSSLKMNTGSISVQGKSSVRSSVAKTSERTGSKSGKMTKKKEGSILSKSKLSSDPRHAVSSVTHASTASRKKSSIGAQEMLDNSQTLSGRNNN